MGTSGCGKDDIGDDYRGAVEASVLRVECGKFRGEGCAGGDPESRGTAFF